MLINQIKYLERRKNNGYTLYCWIDCWRIALSFMDVLWSRRRISGKNRIYSDTVRKIMDLQKKSTKSAPDALRKMIKIIRR